MVKKCGLLKIVHDQFKKTGKRENTVLTDYLGSFEAAMESNKDLESLLGKNQVILMGHVYLLNYYGGVEIRDILL